MIISFFFFVTGLGYAGSKLSCLNENGVPVDMFLLYKLPKINWSHVPAIVREGKGYLYLDSNDTMFRFGYNSIDNSKSPPGRTLNQIYQKHNEYPYMRLLEELDNMAHIFYNDQPPGGDLGESMNYGISKGAVAFDNETGFWLFSSVPYFPDLVPNGYEFPESGLELGQMIICVTLEAGMFDQVGVQLRYMNPNIYDYHLPKEWEKTHSNVTRLLKGEIIKNSFINIAHLSSYGGLDYVHLAKSPEYHKDLYFDLIAPTLSSSLICQSTQGGIENIGPSCGIFSVVDVSKMNISLPGSDYYVFPFHNHHDNSKYAVTDSPESRFVCIGDHDRETTQMLQPGGALCIEDVRIWRQFHELIVDHSNCVYRTEEL